MGILDSFGSSGANVVRNVLSPSLQPQPTQQQIQQPQPTQQPRVQTQPKTKQIVQIFTGDKPSKIERIGLKSPQPQLKQPSKLHERMDTIISDTRAKLEGVFRKEQPISNGIVEVPKPTLEQKISDIQTKATLPQKVELSKPIQAIYEASQTGAEFIRKLKPDTIPTVKPVETKITSAVFESGARVVEMAGMIPAGFETLVRHKELVKPALAVGLYGSTIGFGKALKEDPLQTISDIVVTAGVLKGLGAAIPKKAIPYTIARKATIPEGVLLKGEIKVPKVDIKPPRTTAITEFKPPKVETFVGKVKGEMAELFVKVPESEIGMLKTITSEKAPYQVMTPIGKFTVIDKPTYLDVITTPRLKLAGETKLSLRERVADKVPFEIIPKVDLTQVRLQTMAIPERVMIPEFLRTVDVTPSAKGVKLEFVKEIEGTKGLLETGKIGEFKDFTEPFRRKDIQEIPYTKDVSFGISEESALLGRMLSKQERGLVRDTIIKERIDFEPIKTTYKPARTEFKSVGGIAGQQLLLKPKAAPTKLMEPSPIQTINLETDLRMPDTMAQIVIKTKAAPTKLKEPIDVPLFDVESMLKRPTYGKMSSETKVSSLGKTTIKTKDGIKSTFVSIPKSKVRTFNVIGSAYGQIPGTKHDLVSGIGIPSIPKPKIRTGTIFDSIIDIEPITETKPILEKIPPKAKVTFDYPPIKQIVIPPRKKEKKEEKKKRKTKPKGFQYFIENPIASPFGNSVGRAKR